MLLDALSVEREGGGGDEKVYARVYEVDPTTIIRLNIPCSSD
jgi:hypothetical protein